jgi:1-acyl-sn-glycerol-3-phosphate acyltransferase
MTNRRRTWLLPALAPVCSAAIRIFYQFRCEGENVPARGAVLFVANHPNSLVDPVAVTAVAGRSIRFLAKAPLFEEKMVGWLVRAGGAIPVYRRQDDPALTDRNARVFEAVHDALESGDAVGIFPEGLSHSEPSLARLRTGAARIALGAADRRGIRFPIVPVGIILRQKERFRSEALGLAGSPVEWADLNGRAEEDAEAVRDLTGRIERALRDVTINVERLEDRPTIECAEAVYAAELGLGRSPEERIQRMRQASETLSRLRREKPEGIEPVYSQLRRFSWALGVLRLRPEDLDRPMRTRAAIGWTIKVFGLLLVGGPIAAAGAVVFFLPYRLTDWLAMRPHIRHDRRSTWKLLGGAAIYLTWIALLSVAATWFWGPRIAVGVAVGLPILALITQGVRDRWSDSVTQARRYVLLRRKGSVREKLLRQRHDLGRKLDALRGDVRDA